MVASEVKERISKLLGVEATNFRKVTGGYSPASRWLFSAGDQTFFAKAGTNDWTNKQLLLEINAYTAISESFIPEFVASDTTPECPLLILEDLSRFRWPPPWQNGDIEQVLSALDDMHNTSADLPAYADIGGMPAPGWIAVASNPKPFLSLGVASSAWLESALPHLIAAEAECPTTGNALTHFDIRSDNMCLSANSAKLIDWNGACLGNPKLDLGFWLPSLAAESGPAPEDIIGHEPEIAAFVSGYFAAHAGLPAIPDAPHVRKVQTEQLQHALPWAIRALRLPLPANAQQ